MYVNLDRSMLLARSNIRKAKKQIAAIIVLVLLASIMMNLWLILSMDYKKNFDRCHNRLNDGHVNLAVYSIDADFTEFIFDTLETSADITQFSIDDALCSPCSFEYNEGEISQLCVILEKETALSRETGKFEITEDGSIASGIYLPMLYGTGNNYSIGDTITLNLAGQTFKYTICGFFNNTMSGSHNCGFLSFLLTEDAYRELSRQSCALKSEYISIRIKDKMQGEKIESALKDTISEKFPHITIAGNYYTLVTTSRYISQMICAGIMSAMAFFVLLIAVVVIASNVANYIQENMQNLGAFKAVGYTSRQLISALIIQFSGTSGAAACIAAALSYCIFPAVNNLMVAQTGIPYNTKVLIVPFLITVISISGIVAAAVYLSARGIKKIEPITAIRQGIAVHNFKKNHVPLEKTSLPLHIALAMKTTLSRLKQNVAICVTMLVISLILVFSGVMFENTILNTEPIVAMIAGESADACININVGREQEFISQLQKDSRIEKFYLYTNNNIEIQHVGGISLAVSVTDDCSKLNNQTMLIEGRFPKYDNEFAVAAKYAKEHNLAVGDELTLKIGNTEDNYIISGLIQNTNSLGRDCIMTREGFEKVSNLQNVSYYINLTEGTDIDAFNSEISAQFGSDVNAVFNILSILDGSSKVYVWLVTIIVTAILILSCVIIIFVLYLLVRTLLNGKKRDYGILKALGFTTGQLVLQTAMSFMPSIIISSLVGFIISVQIINPLITLFLSGIGIVKCTFAISLTFNIVAGIGLIAFAFLAACLMSLRIKKIAPRKLLSGE